MNDPRPDERGQGVQPGAPSGAQNSTSPIAGPAPYRALKGSEIRLLSVAPGAWDDQVSCTIHYVPLDEGPEYVALSYTWGDATDQVEILLDGHRHRATRSLFTALRRYRRLCAEGRGYKGFTFSCLSPADGGGTTYIWADALCINQADGREKEREIPRMREVYTLCSRVCAWLGEDDGCGEDAESRAVLEECERWIQSGSARATLPRDVFTPTVEASQVLQRKIESRFGPRVEIFLDVWRKLANRDWFERVWVIQEAALPAAQPILIVGGYLFSFERLSCIWMVVVDMLLSRDLAAEYFGLMRQGAIFGSRVHAQHNSIQTEADTEDGWVRFGRALGAAMLHRGLGTFKATSPHDFLYSMIGLCGGGELLPPNLAPDYQKPFPMVCEEYARCIIKATGSVAILGRQWCDLDADYDTEEKPWVPDFRSPQMPISVKGDMDPSAVSFVGPGERFLKVRGFSVGEVTLVYIPLKYKHKDEGDNISFGEHLRHHHKFLMEVSRERNIHPDDAVADWLARTVEADDKMWRKDKAVHVDFRPCYDHYLQLEDDDGSSAGSLQDSEDTKRFYELARGRILDHPIVLCKGGVEALVEWIFSRLSHVKNRPELGDRLVALSGCTRPFLVRPVLTSEGQGHALISSCDASDRDSTLLYVTDDFSLEFYDESEFEDFILT